MADAMWPGEALIFVTGLGSTSIFQALPSSPLHAHTHTNTHTHTLNVSYRFTQIKEISTFCSDPEFFFISALIQYIFPTLRLDSIQFNHLFAVRLKTTSFCISVSLFLVGILPTLSVPLHTIQCGLMQLYSSEQGTMLCDILARSEARTIEGMRPVWSA
jgi:hypothetical protein